MQQQFAEGGVKCFVQPAISFAGFIDAQSNSWEKANRLLKERGVTLISAGLDEVPMVYKDIHTVMTAQSDPVEVLGLFDPKLVKMAPHGERPED